MMTRRSTIGGLLAAILGAFGLRSAKSQETYATYGREGEPIDIEGLKAALGYPVEEVHGSKALARWQELRSAGKGYPVIVGGPEELSQFVEQATFDDTKTTDEIIAVASQYDFPDRLIKARQAEREAYFKEYPEDGTIEEFEADVGEWPADAPASPGLTVHADVLTGKPFARCFIVTFPTDRGYEVPAFAKWGGWNANPMPDIHVAALKSWEERYGAELIGMDSAVLNFRVTRRPESREEALDLAREQYAYCEDIVDQGVGTISSLAASLMDSDWWYFWWD